MSIPNIFQPSRMGVARAHTHAEIGGVELKHVLCRCSQPPSGVRSSFLCLVSSCFSCQSDSYGGAQTCVDAFALRVRMGVGSARFRLVCESMRIANPHHKCTAPTPRRKRLWHGDSHNIKKACESLSDSRESAWLASLRIANPHHRLRLIQSLVVCPQGATPQRRLL